MTWWTVAFQDGFGGAVLRVKLGGLHQLWQVCSVAMWCSIWIWWHFHRAFVRYYEPHIGANLCACAHCGLRTIVLEWVCVCVCPCAFALIAGYVAILFHFARPRPWFLFGASGAHGPCPEAVKVLQAIASSWRSLGGPNCLQTRAGAVIANPSASRSVVSPAMSVYSRMT